MGRRRTDRRKTFAVTFARKLYFENRAAGSAGSGGCHLVWRANRDRKGGRDRLWLRHAGKDTNRDSASFCLKIPQRAVDRVSRGAGRKEFLNASAIRAALDHGPHRSNLGQNAFRAFSIAGIRNAFAAAANARAAEVSAKAVEAANSSAKVKTTAATLNTTEIGRASCRERVLRLV